MREGTSGLLFTRNKNGSIRVEVVDYGVAEFDGCDWECWYDLDKTNADLLYEELRKLHKGNFEEMLIKEFGETFNIRHFQSFCKEQNIKYDHMTWSSF